MSTKNIIRAWKDEAYRESLSEAERALLPGNPAGIVELTDADLGGAAGGISMFVICTIITPYCSSLDCGGTNNSPPLCV